jgi:peptide/nickel transport system permease protein
MSFITYAFRRSLLSIIGLFGVIVTVFFISHFIPVDPVVANLGQKAMSNPEIVATFKQTYGLDKPIGEQFVMYLSRMAKGDLGTSIRSRRPVIEDLVQYLPATLELTLVAITFSTIFGILLGMLGALHKDSWIDQIARFISLMGVSLPVFWLALIVLIIFYWKLGIAPGPGRLDSRMATPDPITGLLIIDSLIRGDFHTLWIALKHLVLPSIVLGSQSLGMVTRVMRSSLLGVLHQDYVRTAQGKGLRQRVVILSHAIPNALIPTITVQGLAFGSLLSGAIMTETIFAWPGIGRYAFQSTITVDFPAIMGVTLFIALSYTLVNLFVDMLYSVVDPRIRFS